MVLGGLTTQLVCGQRVPLPHVPPNQTAPFSRSLSLILLSFFLSLELNYCRCGTLVRRPRERQRPPGLLMFHRELLLGQKRTQKILFKCCLSIRGPTPKKCQFSLRKRASCQTAIQRKVTVWSTCITFVDCG